MSKPAVFRLTMTTDMGVVEDDIRQGVYTISISGDQDILVSCPDMQSGNTLIRTFESIWGRRSGAHALTCF
jgi:hypothetical protein